MMERSIRGVEGDEGIMIGARIDEERCDWPWVDDDPVVKRKKSSGWWADERAKQEEERND